SITLNGAFASADGGQIWMAARAGFFKQQGITNVNMLNTSLGGAAQAALLLSGASQFVEAGASSLLAADQVGGSVRAIAALDYGSTEEVAITQTAANAHHIPATAANAAQAKAQLLALRGSHLNIAVTTTSSDAVTWFGAELKMNGLTFDTTPSGSADVNLVPIGSPATAFAAVTAGREDGIALTPPYTVVTSPPTITIPVHLLPPANQAVWGVVCVDQSFITQHGDVVQAFMNALVEANHFAKLHPQHAYKLYTDMMTASGITSPEEIQYLWAANHVEWLNLIPTKSGFTKLVTLINTTGITSISVPFTTFVNNKFAINAYKNNGLAVPTTT
ncbi:MAG: hypothetical protein JWM85_2561, partial [Acidimicrobiaceae bacterium]|nr:hypothetical protein [Acidimicrobiaceae bacterium]